MIGTVFEERGRTYYVERISNRVVWKPSLRAPAERFPPNQLRRRPLTPCPGGSSHEQADLGHCGPAHVDQRRQRRRLATGAAASNVSDAILYELSRKFPDLEEDAAIDFIGDDEITFYSGNRHRSCRIRTVPHPKLKDEIKSVSFSNCRVIHG